MRRADDGRMFQGCLVLLLMAFCLPVWLSAQTRTGMEQGLHTYSAQVRDDQTGEALPYVTIYASANVGTLTNYNGDFSIQVQPDTPLCISCIGYQRVTILASQLPKVIRMKPAIINMKEVTVTPVKEKNIIKAVIKQLKHDYDQNDLRESTYFYRTLVTDSINTQLIEAFMQGLSAVNVRYLHLISGVKGIDTEGEESDLIISRTNVHNLLGLGPQTYEEIKWEGCIKPLENWKTTKRHYTTQISSLTQDDGTLLYRVEFQPSKSLSTDNPVLSGTAYIQADKNRLLRFDGQVMNLYMRTDDQRAPMPLKFHIEYNYRHDCAEVENLALEGNAHFQPKGKTPYTQLNFRSLLYRMRQPVQEQKLMTMVGDNLITAIDNAGYDPTMWQRYDVIQRTADEEKIAFGESLKVKKQRPEQFVSIERPDNQKLYSQVGWMNVNAGTQVQEKVFVHMDNTSYCLGDTLWFSAYLRRTDKDRPSDISNVLYVELLNQDGYLVQRKFIEMLDGQGNGFFALSQPNMYSGFYELRAYTRWQLNWGVNEHPHTLSASRWFATKELEKNYYRDYEKLYSRVFPVFDQPEVPGQISNTITQRPLQRASLAQSDHKRELKLSLYPEGGNLAHGVQNRVAFEAAWDDGEYAQGHLQWQGISIPATNRGRGMFIVPTGADTVRTVTFVADDGTQAEAKMPQADREAAALMVDYEARDSVWRVAVRLPEAMDSVGLTIMYEGNLQIFRQIREAAALYTFPASQFHTGVQEVTVYTQSGRVLADRLFFAINPRDIQPPLSIQSDKEQYAPCEPIDLQVKFLASGDKTANFSLAVRDGNQQTQTCDDGNILTEMLLSSEIRGFVPHPEWYFQSTDEEHRQALDLLMMTQGWRRFVWQDLACTHYRTMTQPYEQTPILRGMVLRSGQIDPRSRIIREEMNFLHPDWVDVDKTADDELRREKISENIKTDKEFCIHALAVASTDQMSFPQQITQKGYFSLRMPRFYGECMMHMGATHQSSNVQNREMIHQWKELSDLEYLTFKELRKSQVFPTTYQVLIDHPYPRFVKPYTFYQTRLISPSIREEGTDNQVDADVQVLRTIPVNAKRNGLSRFSDAHPALVVDDMDAENEAIDAGMYFADDMVARTYLGDMASRLGVVEHRYGITSTMRTILHDPVAPDDSLYWGPYLKSYPMSYDMMPGEKRNYMGLGVFDKRVIYTDYAPRLEGDSRYFGANLPEIQIADYPYNQQGQRPEYTERFFRMPGFAVSAQFYSPDYSKHPLTGDQMDYRRTLYWNPNVQLDEKGEAHVTLYNNSRTTRISVEAEGQMQTGTLLFSR